MRKYFIMISIVLVLASNLFANEPVDPIPRARYLEFAKSAADWRWAHYDSLVDVWKEKMDPESIWGYRPPSGVLEMASIYANLYEIEKKTEYANRAKRVVLEIGDYRKVYPEEAIERRVDYSDGLPALPDFFTTMRYLRAYDILKKNG
ncbi:MAG: hypothetical protein V2J62_11605, partial [candidate division KSB1 bacterium]|nr:hypothetical protein [candidate division KSB1 bacterium]